MKSPAIVKCPTCGTPVVWCPEQAYRPFCSERCRLIDLGQWESERYTLPATKPLDEKSGVDDE
ncbi:MAG: DNA gyrase inhibitor YacG [Burkholderiales bacterium]